MESITKKATSSINNDGSINNYNAKLIDFISRKIVLQKNIFCFMKSDFQFEKNLRRQLNFIMHSHNMSNIFTFNSIIIVQPTNYIQSKQLFPFLIKIEQRLNENLLQIESQSYPHVDSIVEPLNQK